MVTLSLQSQFNFDAETDVPLTLEDKKVRGERWVCLLPAWCSCTRKSHSQYPHSVKVLFDGRLSGSIIFSYNAKAVDGQLCLDASPNDNGSYFAHSPHATLLEVLF